jgi:hypothetical protein
MKFARTIVVDGLRLELTLQTKDLPSHSKLNDRPNTRMRIESGLSIVAQDIENQIAQGESVATHSS